MDLYSYRWLLKECMSHLLLGSCSREEEWCHERRDDNTDAGWKSLANISLAQGNNPFRLGGSRCEKSPGPRHDQYGWGIRVISDCKPWVLQRWHTGDGRHNAGGSLLTDLWQLNQIMYYLDFFLWSFIVSLCACIAWAKQCPLQPLCGYLSRPSSAHIICGDFFLSSFVASLCACVAWAEV